MARLSLIARGWRLYQTKQHFAVGRVAQKRRIYTQITDQEARRLKPSIQNYATMNPRPVSLREVLETPLFPLGDVTDFLREEFSIRCAERICMMEESIPDYADIPELHKAHSLHMNAFAAVQKKHNSREFIQVVHSIVKNGREMIPLMCKGMCRLVQSPDNEMDEAFVNKFLNEFLLNRIGSNVLLSNYLSLCGDGQSIVDPHCDVTDICQKTAQAVKQLCFNETGYRPIIRVESFSASTSDSEEDSSSSFAFIPAALSYILQELLKNSSVATSKRDYPQPISVIVCADDRRVMIHVGDHAGGIPFDVAEHIWSYLYTTKERYQGEDFCGNGATELGGFGVGLPLSRLYASYLGGSLNLVSLPGYGTHAYVFLPRLPENLVEIVPVRKSGWNATTKPLGDFIL